MDDKLVADAEFKKWWEEGRYRVAYRTHQELARCAWEAGRDALAARGEPVAPYPWLPGDEYPRQMNGHFLHCNYWMRPLGAPGCVCMREKADPTPPAQRVPRDDAIRQRVQLIHDQYMGSGGNNTDAETVLAMRRECHRLIADL